MYPLDQARDPYARYFAQTASTYDAYQLNEYDEHYRTRQDFWRPHYSEMQDAFVEHTMHVLESDVRKTRSAINLAIIGPGLDPMNRDFNHTVLRTCLQKVSHIVVIDFSSLVTRTAMRSLIQSDIPERRVFGMQYDITNGLSTAYQHFIHETLQHVTNENELERATIAFEQMTIEELDRRVLEELQQLGAEKEDPLLPGDVTDEPPPGGMNRGRSLSLSMKKVKLPLDVVSLQMVLAATGAAAEAEIWSRYQEITSSTPDRGARPPGKETEDTRYKMFERIHRMIARFNTATAERIIHQILQDNEDAKVLAITDISTHYEAEALRTGLPRLDVDELRDKLAQGDITVRVTSSGWDWRDEPDHYHHVVAIEADRKNGSGVSGKAPEARAETIPVVHVTVPAPTIEQEAEQAQGSSAAGIPPPGIPPAAPPEKREQQEKIPFDTE